MQIKTQKHQTPIEMPKNQHLHEKKLVKPKINK
jgi:hypothetical protein